MINFTEILHFFKMFPLPFLPVFCYDVTGRKQQVSETRELLFTVT